MYFAIRDEPLIIVINNKKINKKSFWGVSGTDFSLTIHSLGVDQLPVAMRGPQGLVCFLTRTTPIYIHVVYEKNEKPCGPFMAT